MALAKIDPAATIVRLYNLPGVTAEMARAAAPNARVWIDGVRVAA